MRKFIVILLIPVVTWCVWCWLAVWAGVCKKLDTTTFGKFWAWKAYGDDRVGTAFKECTITAAYNSEHGVWYLLDDSKTVVSKGLVEYEERSMN
jgi:hypothetical protein